MSQGRLEVQNCNNKMCKSCIFRTDGNEIKLSPERVLEIQLYLARGEASHICHVTEKTCYGALEYQAKIFFAMKLIPENSVESLLKTAKKFI